MSTKMPVQVRNLNLKLIKWTQTRVTSFVTHSENTNMSNEIVRGHSAALCLRPNDHFNQMAPASQPLVELLNCSAIQTQTTVQPNDDDTSSLLDPCWGQGSTCSLSAPSLPLPPVLCPRSLQSSHVYSSLHIPDFTSTFVKLANSASHNLFIAPRDNGSVASSLLGDKTSWEDGSGIENATVIEEVLTPACTNAWPLRSTWSWNNSDSKNPSVIYRCKESKPSELTCSPSPNPDSSKPADKGNGPSEQQLLNVKERLIQVVPVFFKKTHDYRMYHPNLVYINNFWGKEAVHRGIPAYMLELSKTRILSHLKYAYLQMSIVKITLHPEQGSIRLHWRVSGLPQLKTLQIWKFLPWTYRNSLKSESQFFDGLSTVFIDRDELIYKHRVDRLMRDEEPLSEKSPDLALKLGLLFGLLPRTGF